MALLALSLVLVLVVVLVLERRARGERKRKASRKVTQSYAEVLKGKDLKFVRHVAAHPMVFVGGQGIRSHMAITA